MDREISEYLEQVFHSYGKSAAVDEIKQELLQNLSEKFKDLCFQGYEPETAFRMTIESIGDIKEMMDALHISPVGGSRTSGAQDFSNSDLPGADFSGIQLQRASFKDSELSEVTFRNADLSEADMRDSNLEKGLFRWSQPD